MKKTIRVSEKEERLIKELKEKMGIKSESELFRRAIKEMAQNQDREGVEERLIKNMLEEMEKKFKMTRIRIGTNTAEIGVNAIIEILNSICTQQKVENFYSTDSLPNAVVLKSNEYVREKRKRMIEARTGGMK